MGSTPGYTASRVTSSAMAGWAIFVDGSHPGSKKQPRHSRPLEHVLLRPLQRRACVKWSFVRSYRATHRSESSATGSSQRNVGVCAVKSTSSKVQWRGLSPVVRNLHTGAVFGGYVDLAKPQRRPPTIGIRRSGPAESVPSD